MAGPSFDSSMYLDPYLMLFRVSETLSSLLTSCSLPCPTSHLISWLLCKFLPRHGCFILLLHRSIAIMALTPAKRKRPSEDISNPESSSPKRKVPKTSSDYFQIRDILQYKNGRYLVDWEDNPDTGEKYPQSWEPKKNLNEGALLHWEEKQAVQRAQKKEASKLKNSKKRLTESQQPYEENSADGRLRKRQRVIESSPTLESSVIEEEEKKPENTKALHKIEERVHSPESSQTCSQLAPSTLDKREYASSSPSFAVDSSTLEYEKQLETKDSVSQAAQQELEVLLSQKSIDREEHTSFSASATQNSAADTGTSSNHHFLAGEGSAANDRVALPCDQLTQKATEATQESFRDTILRRAESLIRKSSEYNLEELAPDSPVPRPAESSPTESPQGAAHQNPNCKYASDSVDESTQGPTQESVDSGPGTDSRPSNESYVPPPSELSETTIEVPAETAISDPSLQFHTSTAETSSGSPAKVVPDSQGVENSQSFVPAGTTSDTCDNSYTTTSESLIQGQTQEIPESSPIEVFPNYLCFYAWRDQHVFVCANSRKG